MPLTRQAFASAWCGKVLPDERQSFGLEVHRARYRMRLSRNAFVWAFKKAFPHLSINAESLARIENGAYLTRLFTREYTSALTNFCGLAAPDPKPMSHIGIEIKKARLARNQSRPELVKAFKAAYPHSPMSQSSIKKLEMFNCGSEKMAVALCEFLGIPFDKGSLLPSKTNWHDAKAAIIDQAKESAVSTQEALAPVVKHIEVSDFGFSLVEARNTLKQLKSLGLPTEQVKQAMVCKVMAFIEDLDK